MKPRSFFNNSEQLSTSTSESDATSTIPRTKVTSVKPLVGANITVTTTAREKTPSIASDTSITKTGTYASLKSFFKG